jgi:hypothetical protein
VYDVMNYCSIMSNLYIINPTKMGQHWIMTLITEKGRQESLICYILWEVIIVATIHATKIP